MEITELTFESGKITEPLKSDAREQLLGQLEGWHIEDGKLLVRQFTFPDFVGALSFTQRVGDLAEKYEHHPEIVLEYGKATVKWWTHTANGVAANDFLLARETNTVYDAK